ncbi:MAG: hypothetical protein M1818_006727 [Claussenomyces sp. TS43310]|nr:MAG: hypothetical protein M1818_006727 [Claussenomyces sp. TS43310]
MAPQGRYSRSRLCLAFSIVILAVTFIGIAIFSEDLVSKIQSLKPFKPTAQCSCPAVAPQSYDHCYQTPEEQKHRSLAPTTFTALTTLEELGPTNVLWVNKTDATGSEPEAWGISMFHALHCVKMWKESLDPATMMNSHVHSESEYAEHSSHCINYLIQTIVCAADSTIEPAEDVVDGDKHGWRIHGMGYQHQCRDTTLLFEMDGETVEDWNWRQGDTLHSVFGATVGSL